MKDIDSQARSDGNRFETAQIEDRLSLARAITIVENNLEGCNAILEQAEKAIGRAHVVGFTGPPGVGKSTLIDACIASIRQIGQSVAVVAVDPSSEASGGAILGDRLRMAEHTRDDAVFIRSVAARGQLGGVSATTVNIVNLFDASGWNTIIIETVGAGQSEIDISKIADTTVVVQSPGYGDDIQAIKAGLLEVADVLVVNKSDLPDADRVAIELEQAVSIRIGKTKPQVVKTAASNCDGISELMGAIDSHRHGLENSGEHIPAAKRMKFFSARLIGVAVENALAGCGDQRLNELRRKIQSGSIDKQALSAAFFRSMDNPDIQPE